jgi:hypothetical protein
MPRPHKNPEDRKDYHLRVPLTEAQLALIEEAVRLEGDDKAGWARTILLDAAKKRIKQARKSDPESV